MITETQSKMDLEIRPLPRTPEQDVLSELDALFSNPAKSLIDFLNAIVFGGEAALFKKPVQALPVFRTTSTSGYNFSYHKKMMAYVRFGVTTSGYFVVQSCLIARDGAWLSHYYSADGKYAFSEGPISHQFAEHPEKWFDPRCPIVNHIYNILAANYAETQSGKINTRQIHTLQLFVRRLRKSRPYALSVTQGAQDPALVAIRNQMIEIEQDPVYTWKERHHLIAALRTERSEMVRMLTRAHSLSRLRFTPALLFADLKDLFVRFGERPLDNLRGILERILVDPLRWFWGVVKDNMGYSVALAIYSPFTFFFITQPMNPHAMWAVGNVRTAYLDTAEKVKHIFGMDGKTVSTAQAGQHPVAGAAAASAIASTTSVLAGMEVTANQSALDAQTWSDRMSDFKALQIRYEENMPIAPRLGRLEQMETQYNWPLHLESAWMETERYMSFLDFVQANIRDYAPAFVEFVRNERYRAEQVQLYLWDKNVRFILDHPYTMMDKDKEQTQFDYYTGRPFILLRDMTMSLAKRYKSLPMPAGYDSIVQLAQKYESEYKTGGSVLDRLKANSRLFGQNDPKNTDELRNYMQRQWEILYLLQNKTQEASNNGLQLYIWSVRNTVYLIQSLYSSKREEMSLLALNFKTGAIVNKLSTNTTFQHIDSQYEALYHMMVLEFASLQKEFGEALTKDLETTQRKKIIGGVESFLKERDTLLKGANLL